MQDGQGALFFDVGLRTGFPLVRVVKKKKKNLPANAGDIRAIDSIPGSEISPGGGRATHSSIFAWRIPIDRGAWGATVHRVAQSWTRQKLLSTHAQLEGRAVW